MTFPTQIPRVQPSQWSYLKWTSFGAWIVLPAFVQIGLFVALFLSSVISSASHLNHPLWTVLYAAIALAVILMSAYFAQRVTDRAEAPASFLARFGPALAPLFLMCIAWIMYTRNGIHMQNKGASTHLLWVFLPYFFVGVAAVFSKPHWLLVIPSVAGLGFLFFVWWAHRHQTLNQSRGILWMPVSLIVMGCWIGLQFWQDQTDLVSTFTHGEKISEGVELRQYQPFKPENKLVKIEPSPDLQFNTENAPRLDGATAAYPVYAAMAQAMYPRDQIAELAKVSTTPKAYESLINGHVDAIFVAQASAEQAQIAKEKGVQLNFTPIGKEAFVFVVNSKNPIQSLSVKQLQDIYAGRIQRWNAVGGISAVILPFQRPPNSGSQTIMQAKVMQGQAMRQPMQEEVQQGMGGLVRQVAAYRNSENALGYSFRFYVTQMLKQGGIKLLHIDGIESSLDNIRSGKYPLTVDVYMVTTQQSRSSVDQLRDWVLSPAGQKLIQDTGYISR
jgi:phosphate transport system substrate-binding protein